MTTRRALSSLARGEKGTVVAVRGTGHVHRRMLDMGIVPGTTVEVAGVAPLGDPIAVRLKCYRLSLRKAEAAQVEVEMP